MARATARSNRGKTAASVPAGPQARPAAGLALLAFVAGAVMMSLEIVGSRVLAPHFGNSVFVWGSLISVILGALAGGYWFGGRLADRGPRPGRLLGLCLASAALILVIPSVGHPLCRSLLRAGLDERTGPLLGAALLFLPASFFLGAISPFTVRLAATDVASIGRVAGSLYAVSTIGSIVGTLLSTFVLIPQVGTGSLLKGLGVIMLLAAVAVAVMARVRPSAPLVLAVLGVAAGALLPSAPAAVAVAGELVLHEEETAYHRIRVVDVPSRDQRLMQFGRFVQGGISLQPPYPTIAAYTDYFHLALVAQPNAERVLFIGAGAGLGPRWFLTERPTMEIDVVDVDPRVAAIAERYFHMPIGGRLRAYSGDGRMFLSQSSRAYDIIVLDAFTAGGRMPFHLATEEFFALCASRLRPGGVLAVNLNGTLSGPGSQIWKAILGTIAAVYPVVEVFASSGLDVAYAQALVVIAGAQGPPMTAADWGVRLAARRGGGGPRLDGFEHNRLAALPPLDGSPLTDDFAPLETMPLGF